MECAARIERDESSVGRTPRGNRAAQSSHADCGRATGPIVSTRQFGRGGCSLTTDTTWHWDFKAAGAGQDNRHYYKFWGNAIRWIIRDPELKAIRVKTDRDRYPMGRSVEIMAQVMGADYRPAQSVDVELRIQRRTESGQVVQAPTVLKGKTNDAGEFVARFDPPADGPWTVVANADNGGDVSDTDVFVVATDPVELRETAPRPKLLQAIAKAGGGEARTLREGLDGLERVTPDVLKVNRRKDVPIWSSWAILALALLFPSLEWFLRRRWGLL